MLFINIQQQNNYKIRTVFYFLYIYAVLKDYSEFPKFCFNCEI